MQNSYYQHSQ